MSVPHQQEDRVALVTGAARGIGAATVAVLCERGFRVLALDLAAGEEHTIAGAGYPMATCAELEALKRYDDRVVTVAGDVRDPAVLESAAARAVTQWGRLDVAVAAAAVLAGGRPLWETPLAELESQWQVDVLGVWHAAVACVPRILSGPEPSGGRFVAVASAAGARGLFHLAAYTTVKHAVIGLVRGLAADLVGTGVAAVAVSPGATRTPMLEATAAVYGLEDLDELAASQLVQRVLEPEEVAAVIAFCCSREGVVLNGSVVSADGGFAG